VLVAQPFSVGPPPNRTCQFPGIRLSRVVPCSRRWVLGQLRRSAFRVPPCVSTPDPCCPSPCARLSRAPWPVATPATTMAAPLPWASRPGGSPAFRRVRRPSVPSVPRSSPCVRSFLTVQPAEGFRSQLLDDRIRLASRQAWCSTDDRFHPWGLGFRQCSFHRSTRASRGQALHAFRPAPLRRHAVVPLGFRRQVSRWPTSVLPNLSSLREGSHAP
jgi:hypothetical protein